MENTRIINLFPSGEVRIPPSKSLSHRALICASLAALNGGGHSTLYDVGDNEDIRATMNCLSNLGVLIQKDEDVIRVYGSERIPSKQMMNCSESGSTLRFLIPIAAIMDREYTFTGEGRLLKRPMDLYEKLFHEKGAQFNVYRDRIVLKGPLPPSQYTIRGDVSSQFVSGLLFALPLLPGNSTITIDPPLESIPYVKLTINVMKHFGVHVENKDYSLFHIKGNQSYISKEYRIEGDWSQAAFFLASGLLGCPVKCQNLSLSSAQGDMAILEIIRNMGGEIANDGGSIMALPSTLSSIDIDVREIPDLVPVLAVLCSLAKGRSHISGAGRLRHKESDRLSAITAELRKLGANIEERAEGLIIEGREFLDGGNVDAHNDHRIAMSMAVAAIKCKNPVKLTGWDSVNKSYPEFWKDFQKEARYE